MAAYRQVDDLTVTCRLAACTSGSAPGPTLGIEYGKPLPLPFYMCVDNVTGYRVAVPTSSTLALLDSHGHNNRVQLVADQAVDTVFHHSDVPTTSSTGSQSPPGFRDVIVTWFICASAVRRFQRRVD